MIKREFQRTYVERFGEEWLKQLIKKMKEPYPKYIRTNTLKIAPKELRKRLEEKGFALEKVKHIGCAFRVVEEPFSISSTEEYLLGYMYIQDKASMFPSIELNPLPTDVVLDTNSAPGGKATHLAQIMENRGIIVAIDSSKERLASQLFNIQRLGVKNVASFHLDALKVKSIGLRYDKALIDAPCSATGTFWKEKRRAKEVNKHKVEMYSSLQKSILKKSYEVLKPKGAIVYATCSMEREEDEDNAEFAEKELGLKLIKERRFFPHTDDTIGFYYAVFRKD